MARRPHRGRAWRETRSFYLFIAPWLIGFVLLSVVPLALGFATSLTNYDGFNLDNLKFRGLANYARILDDDDDVYSFGRTLVFAALNVPLGIAAALGLATLLNQTVRGRGAFRTLFY